MSSLHKLLIQQLAEYLPGAEKDPAFTAFLDAVNAAYTDKDNNRKNSEGIKIKQPEVKNKEQFTQQPVDRTESSGIGTFSIDFTGMNSTFSENAAKLLGLTVEETRFSENLLLNLRKHVHQDDLEMLDQAWIRAVYLKKDVHTQFRLISSDGKVSYLDWNVRNLFSQEGKLIHASGTLEDMTAKVLDARNSAMAKLIIENSPTILIRWRLEEGWPVEYISENILQFGYTSEEFVTGAARYDQLIYSEDLPRIQREVQQYQEQGAKLYNQVYRVKTKSGELRWVEDRTMVEQNSDNSPRYHQGLITDITDKMNAENALAESESRFRSMVQNSSDITTILNPEGIISYKSPAFYRILGFTPEEVTGLGIYEFIYPEDIQLLKDKVNELINGIQIPTILIRFINKSGALKHLEITAANELNNPNIKGIVFNSRDISERVMNQQQLMEYSSTLEKINKELDQFAYIISHDLKAPLRAISNLSIWIEEDLGEQTDPAIIKNFELLRSRIKRMEGLISGVLEYSRAGRIKSELQPINLKHFIKDIIENLGPPENFKIDIDENLPEIIAEKLAIEQVFSNYISNTIKYNNNPEPVVKIGSVETENYYQFFVSDNGPGIDPEFHIKIFEIFQTLQARDQVESTGVGLAIVKKIVEEKGGKVWVESTPGEGTHFYFTLPKSQ